MRANKKPPLKAEKKTATPSQKRGGLSYSRNTALLEEAITQMNAGKYGRSSAALKELLGLDPHNMEARRLFATLHLRLGSLIPARQAFDSLINEALERQDYWLAESLLREYLAAGPRCVPFLEKLGGLYEEKGDALEAVTEYGKAIDILIEDPDPEHPHRAEELFAKIRELAPASPVAFRLSASFDAQTGALTARPMAALTSESISESVSVEPGEGISEAAAPSGEPMAGIMSWDQVVDRSATGPASPAVDSPVSAGPPEEPLSVPEGCVAEARTGMAVETPVVSVEPSFLEPCERICDVANTASSPAEDVQPVQPLQFIADQSIADGIPENLIARAEPISVLPSGFNAQPEMVPLIEENHPVTLRSANEAKTTIESGAGPLPWEPVQATAVPVETVGRSRGEPELSGTDAQLFSSPLPWEQVQDAVHIPDPFPPQLLSEPEATCSVAQLPVGIESDPVPWEQAPEAPVHISDVPKESVAPQEPIAVLGEPLSLLERTWPDRQRAQADAQTPDAVREPVTSPVEPLLESEALLDDTLQAHAASESEVALTPCQTEQEAPVHPLSKEIPGASATETAAAPTIAARSAPPADLELAKKPAFSWKAVFSRGWKAADYSPARVLSPEPVPYKVPPNLASLNSALEAVSCDSKELVSVPLATAEPTTRSISLEEVQQVVPEAFIVESETTVAPTNAEAGSGLPTAAEQVQDQSGLETSRVLDADTEVPSLSAVDAPAVPMPSEFHLLAGDSGSSVEPPASRQSETSIPSGTPGKEIADAFAAIAAPLPQSLVEATAETTEPEPTVPSCLLEPSGGHTTTMPRPLRDSHAPPLIEVLALSVSRAAEPVLQGDESTTEPFTIFAEEPCAATDCGGGATAKAMSDKEPGTVQEAVVYATPEPASDSQVSRGSAETVLPSGNASSDSPTFMGDPSDWKPAEAVIQVHQPSSPEWEPAAFGHEYPPVPSPGEEATAPNSTDHPIAAALDEEANIGLSEPPAVKDEWIRTGESIRLTEPLVIVAEPGSETPAHDEARALQPVSTAAAAVEALFASSGRFPKTESNEAAPVRRPGRRFSAKLARMRRAISIFVASCFSTTRAMLMSLLALLVILSLFGAMGLGIVAVTWMVMEEPPSSAFHNFTTMPPRTLSDAKNGYVLLLGFNAPSGQDPLPLAYHQEPGRKDRNMVAGCLDGPTSEARSGQPMASAANGLFRGRDPLARIKSHADTIKGWSGQSLFALARYTQWLKSPFEDWGYGQSVRLPCAPIVFIHQLYVAEGFVLGTDVGIDRLEADMEAWRTALVQATSLPVKAIAIRIIEDDAAVASELLAKPDSDAKTLGRLTRMARPLNQAESSIRWPMQSELVWASKNLEVQLKAKRAEGLPVHAAIASMLPLPKQRRLNQYAEYYDAASKVSGEGRYRSIPKRSQHIRVPANGLIDYLGNPIENIIGLEPLPEWGHYTARVGDLDAHLRLLSLQAWLRRGSQEADLLARIAKAGQDFYDPYTGFPMLVNQKKGLLYSVGHDGRDQDADPETDIVVAIPANQASGSTKSSANSFRDH